MVGQRWDVVSSVTEWRAHERKNVQSIIQIGSESTPLDLRLEVAIRCRDNAHVHPACPALAHPFEFTFLQHAQQLGL